INYRIERAYETLEEAKILAAHEHWDTVANRLYYSCFYIVSALLYKYHIVARTHSTTKSEFHKYFIKTQTFNNSLGKLYSDLFDKRQEGDYQDFYSFDKEINISIIFVIKKYLWKVFYYILILRKT
ncbi:MAG: HEPN domain-containing protein, partial [Bacteroidales bacterium]|nr:HEPN domain-containing protein [Bacteroidales bacterium]MCF8333923.1 HEPN domain-containing protein [Bacteroidales bacterium]